jgi:hypothetical protein
MTIPSDGVRFIPGTTDILIVAPHSPVIDGQYQNDLRTGTIAEKIQAVLGCYAIINDRWFKPKGEITKDYTKCHADLFRIDHSRKVPGYLDCIKKVVESSGRTLVVWVHGIADDVAATQGREHIDQGLFSGEPETLHALMGYGQGGDPKSGDPRDCFSARESTAVVFRDRLTQAGMTTLFTHPRSSNFRGRDSKRLNQWFVQSGFGFDQVESIQLEIREKSFRDSRQNAAKAAQIIIKALRT